MTVCMISTRFTAVADRRQCKYVVAPLTRRLLICGTFESVAVRREVEDFFGAKGNKFQRRCRCARLADMEVESDESPSLESDESLSLER